MSQSSPSLAPKLKRVDLGKCCEVKPGYGWHDHAAIKPRARYLARFDGCWYAGSFSRQWFGWSFDLGSHSVQLDKPGTNHSRWEALFEIVAQSAPVAARNLMGHGQATGRRV